MSDDKYNWLLRTATADFQSITEDKFLAEVKEARVKAPPKEKPEEEDTVSIRGTKMLATLADELAKDAGWDKNNEEKVEASDYLTAYLANLKRHAASPNEVPMMKEMLKTIRKYVEDSKDKELTARQVAGLDGALTKATRKRKAVNRLDAFDYGV